MTQTIAKDVMVTLGPDASPELADALRRVPDVAVVEDAPQTTVIVRGASLPMSTRIVGPADIQSVLGDRDEHDGQHWLVLVRAAIDDQLAARLQDADVGYVDAAGRAWLPGQARTRRTRSSRSSATRGLRAPSLRLVQLLADHPNDEWTERSLAKRAATTPVTAHHVLARLEHAGLVERRGRGPGTRRQVGDLPGLWRWLATNGRPGRVDRLSCFVSDPDGVPSTIGGLALALTGARAAEQLGTPVLTGIQRATYRVDTHAEGLEDVPRALGGFRTDQGANLILLADPDRLAHNDARLAASGQLLGPPSRVMLDLYLEPRGEAAAELFCDLWPGRE
jgi:hypothetical protein